MAIVLTGDRPSGKLHLGHYIGSLRNRVLFQHEYKQYIIIADVQALTDNYEHPEKVAQSVFDVALDYMAVGIDPKKSTIFVQSCIPEIAELTIFYLNLVTVARLQRNPTVKTEIVQKGFQERLPAGFFVYPVSQAADITCVQAEIVPVGEDQLPMIEQTNEIVRTFNRLYQCDVLKEVKAVVPEVARLMGTDGKAKMSKSLGNAIFLSDDADTVATKVKSMYTDPDHIRVSDPGKVEGNVVFTYLDIFDEDKSEVARLKEQYQRGGLGDMVLKKRLTDILNHFLDPIRARRQLYAQSPEEINRILAEGIEATRDVTGRVMQEVKQAMKIAYTFKS